MKKSIYAIGAFALLCACTQTQYVEKECPSCNPAPKHLEVITECSDYQETQLSGNRYAQCRYCTNKIYSNGVDVTNQFMGQTQPTPRAKSPCRPQGAF